MNREQTHILHLLEWIEKNLENDLSAESVSAKSGYTKWHLQKLFKLCTGYTMAVYIRNRRLCKAAFELKFTTNNISAISQKLQFDSQQSFTRAFTYKYRLSPDRYRKKTALTLGQYFNKHSIYSELNGVTCEYVSFDHLVLYGFTGEYYCPIENIKDPHRAHRKERRKKFIIDNRLHGVEVFTLTKFRPFDKATIVCDYHIGVKDKSLLQTNENLPVLTGDYLKFQYYGDEDGIYDFVMSIYFKKFLGFNLVRRDDFDIEIFKYINDTTIEYNFLIPIIFDGFSIIDLLENS